MKQVKTGPRAAGAIAMVCVLLAFAQTANAATFNITSTVNLDHEFLAGTTNSGGLPQPPSSFTTPSYLVGLDFLNPALAPLLQQVDVSIAASTTDRLTVNNPSLSATTLNYASSQQLTAQVSSPVVGPYTGTAATVSGSILLPGNTPPQFLPPTAGSSVSATATFTGASAQQFAGTGQFNLELFEKGTVGLTTTPTCMPCFQNVNLNSQLSGTASVSYTLQVPTSPIALTFEVPLDHASGPTFSPTPGAANPSPFLDELYSATLARLDPALASLLQGVKIEIQSSNSDTVILNNRSLSEKTLSYQLQETLSAKIDDPTLPGFGPVSGTTASLSGSETIPFNLVTNVGPFPGSTLSAQAWFTGSQAQQFVGPGTFDVHILDSGTLGLTVEDCSSCSVTGSLELSGYARVTYILGPRQTAQVPEPGTLIVLSGGLAALFAARRRGSAG